jgi:hypothetical protein
MLKGIPQHSSAAKFFLHRRDYGSLLRTMSEPVYDDIGAVEVRKLLGGVSKAWLQRRLDPRHPEYDPTFPGPVQYTENGRRYWSRGEILAYRESKRQAATARREARLRGAAKEYVGRVRDDG